MQRQPNLFSAFADVSARQSGLFDGRPVEAVGTGCEECGRVLIETAGGWLCCPVGHGRLEHDGGLQCVDCGAVLRVGTGPVLHVHCLECQGRG